MPKYQRNYKTVGDYKHIAFNDPNLIGYQPSLVNQFYKEEGVSVESGEPIVIYHDPIYMLFDQQRLSKLGSGAVEMWLSQMANSRANPLAELRKECSDDDLLTMVKSRHLQSPSEILSWAQYMTANVEKFKSEVAKLVSQKQAQSVSSDIDSPAASADSNVVTQ